MRNVLQRFLAAALGACALAVASPASAADFTFTAPVDVSELPPALLQGRVTCIVTQRQPGAFVEFGRASSDFALTGGAYRGNVVVEVTVGRDRDPAQTHRYDCEIWFQIRRTSGTVTWMSASALAQPTGPSEGRIRSVDPLPGRRTYQTAGPLNGASFP